MTIRETIPFPGSAAPLEGRRISLIGGAGFIGHHLAVELTRQGAQVQVVDGLQVNHLIHMASQRQLPNQSRYLEMLHDRLDRIHEAGVDLKTVDARDYMKLSAALSSFEPHVVVQLAAVAHANRSNKDPYTTFDHSLRTLENALDYARGRCDHFLYFSSSMVYGNFQAPVIDEDHPLDPIGIYGALKLSGEKIVQAYQQVFDLPYTIIRPAALYGPRCVSRRVSQVFLENAFQGKPLRVEGDGEESIPFTYIDDLVAGVTLAIQKPAGRNQTFNITYGQARTINDLIGCIQQEFPGIQVEHTERDNLRPLRGTTSIDKARNLLGYEPASSLELGIHKCVEWYRSCGWGAPQTSRLARSA
jgi:nucleoside-diphosphate-sugar epimerase